MILWLAFTPDPVDLGDPAPTGPDPTVAVRPVFAAPDRATRLAITAPGTEDDGTAV